MSGRNCTEIRGPACATFGTACSQVRWQLPPITTTTTDHIAEVVIDCPPVNALTVAQWFELGEVVTAAGNVAGHVQSGKLRVVGVAAPKRQPGVYANVPTWSEQGVKLVYGGWRGIMAPKGVGAAEVAYWEGVLRKAAQSAEWKTELERNYWSDDFVTSAQFRKDLDKDYADTKSVLTELGLAK